MTRLARRNRSKNRIAIMLFGCATMTEITIPQAYLQTASLSKQKGYPCALMGRALLLSLRGSMLGNSGSRCSWSWLSSLESHMVKARRRKSETEVYKAKQRVWSSIPFSAFWLRSSVVIVLISLISDSGPLGHMILNLFFLGGEPTTVACYWAAWASV